MPDADLVIKNARVITMNPRQPRADAVAVRNGGIMAVGAASELEAVSGPRTRVIDLGGRALVPGFIDAHCHLFSHLRQLLSVDVSPAAVSSVEDIIEAVGRQAAITPKGAWISGTGYNEFYLAGRRCPTRHDLDTAAPEHPVVLSHRSLHACVLNSRALDAAGIGAATPDPPGGYIERDTTGEPTGLLFELLGYIRDRITPLSEEELARGVGLLNESCLSQGITSLHEATISNNLARYETLRRFKEEGSLASRVYMMLGSHAVDDFNNLGLATGSGTPSLKIGAVKMMVGNSGGKLDPPEDVLCELALTAQARGFQLALHAIEEVEVAGAVAVMEHLSRRAGIFGRRHRIEHCSECPPYLLDRISALPVMVVTQPPFVHYSGERYLATVLVSQQPWLYRIKSLLDAGVPVAASSDAPVVPNNPIMGIYGAVTRRAASGQYVLPEEGVSAYDALKMYTVNAAYAAFEEGIKGTLEPGKLADMVVLNGDPLELPAEELQHLKVEMTVVGGEVVWEG